jgi:SAM-dependent methyltransferase
MEPERWRMRARSFGPAAAVYDRVRPPYPVEAVECALRPAGAAPLRVLDIGAGTGILTRLLLSLGHTLTAVEPDPDMLRRLGETAPAARALTGRAESIPLDDASVDAAMAGQAYHWFDREPAHAELARVIRRGGVFAAIWNVRDESITWVAEYSRIVEGDRAPDGAGADASGAQKPEFGSAFGPVEFAEFRHAVQHTPETLVELLRSRSTFLTATPEQRKALEAEVTELATTHPELAGRESIPLPYRTLVYRATRLPTV